MARLLQKLITELWIYFGWRWLAKLYLRNRRRLADASTKPVNKRRKMTKRSYNVPDRMHYDVFAVIGTVYVFKCSCAKEADAIHIMDSLALRDSELEINGVTYKLRARPSDAHTIYRASAKDYD